ncbi:hypothetical protein NKH77_40690 [Streptomyces sp. M19]
MSAPRPADPVAPVPVSRSVAGPETPVQRKVGFEFEVIKDDKWKVSEVDEDGSKAAKTDTKAALIDLPRGLSYVAADNGNVEFVTRPLTTLTEVREAMDAIVAFHKQLSKDRTYEKNDDDGHYLITVAGAGRAKPQATLGVKMEHVGQLVAQLEKMRDSANPEPPAPTGRRGPHESPPTRPRSRRTRISATASPKGWPTSATRT